MSQSLTNLDLYLLQKTDLHRHLDGAARAEVIRRVGGVKLPQNFEELYCFRPGMSVEEILQCFGWAIAAMRTPKGLEECAYQAVVDAMEDNIIYLELRYAPGYHSDFLPPWYDPSVYEEEPFPPMTLDDTVAAALRGIQRGEEETGTVANLTLCIARECMDWYGKGSAKAITDLALRWQDKGVVSEDVACKEPGYPLELFAAELCSTVGSKIRRNPHAGEMGDSVAQLQNIWHALYTCHADRIGHAYPLHHREDFMRAARERGIGIERHPLASPVFAPPLAQSGLDALLDADIRVSLVSDDPVLYRQTLTENFIAVRDAFGWGEEQIMRLIANGVKSAFFRDAKQKRRVEDMFVRRGLSRALLKE